jgi:radical SAM protein with 4Fe4S-binding SPASM domain
VSGPGTAADYHAVSARLRAKATAGRIPVAGSFELTERCDLACAHCYINRPADDAAARANELPFDRVSSVLEEIARAGCLWLAITGGEPLVRSDFARIYSRARELGFLITVFTNATLVTDDIAALFRRLPPFSVEVTVYGTTRGVYEGVTRVPGSFDACMDGIARLLDAGVRLELKSTISTLNRHEAHRIRALAEALGAQHRSEMILNRRLDGGGTPAHLALPPEEIARIELADRAVRELRLAAVSRRPRATSPGSPLYGCSAGIRAFHVDARGRLMPCIMVREPAVALEPGGFEEIFGGPIREAVSAVRREGSPCTGCAVADVCDVCPGCGLVEAGDPQAAVGFMCEVARARGRLLGLIPGERDVA